MTTLSIEEWRRDHRLIDHFPLRFDSGAILNEFTGHCNGCSHAFLADELRGEIKYREKFVEIRAMGYCSSCNLFSPFSYDVWDDLSMIGKNNVGNAMAVWSPRKEDK